VSWLSASLFAWIQAAPFYAAAHAQAVQRLPDGNGRTWLDVGCGPGLVARLASRHGYEALGIDRDPAMIRRARQLVRNEHCRFEVGDLEAHGVQHTADVVSAASLLIVVPDARRALARLWKWVRPGGTLLVVETTREMNPARAKAVARGLRPGRHEALTLWARARAGRAIDSAIFQELGSSGCERHSLLDGLIEAWLFRKGTS
jgi:trans-aconitate methyltransferase